MSNGIFQMEGKEVIGNHIEQQVVEICMNQSTSQNAESVFSSRKAIWMQHQFPQNGMIIIQGVQ